MVTEFSYYQSKKLQQFTKLYKGDMSQNSKTAKMVLGRHFLFFRQILSKFLVFDFLTINLFTVFRIPPGG